MRRITCTGIVYKLQLLTDDQTTIPLFHRVYIFIFSTCRTGRCGRAGRKGLVINFANPETKFVIRRFGKKLGVDIHDCEIRDSRVYLKYDN